MTDQRPDPKPRKHPHLWQAYLMWNELVEMRKRHTLRISSIEAGKSDLDSQFEKDFIGAMKLDTFIDEYKKVMIEWGRDLGPVWNWITTIKGLGAGSLAAQLLAQIDDISRSNSVSQLWRFCGQAVIDGKAERNQPGEKSHYNRKLKSICWLVSDQFIKQQTSPYVEIYYNEKKRLREVYPEAIKVSSKTMYNDGHIDNMAKRKMIKIFLQHLWVVWRESENLPVTQPYVQGILGHVDIVPPPNYERKQRQ